MKSKQRYTIYDPIKNFYKRNSGVGVDVLMKQDGYKYNPKRGMNNWFAKYVAKLEKKGYTHNMAATLVTGGDKDFLVIDNKKKEYCFWENGFTPLCYEPKEFPVDKDLEYWADNRH